MDKQYLIWQLTKYQWEQIGRNLEDTMELFKLTESQADFLSNKNRALVGANF